MKVKKISKFAIGATLALSLVLGNVMPASYVEAASEETEYRYIKGDGVRLRKQGYTGGTVLELMYNNESIVFYPQRYGTDSEYNYMRRIKTSTCGYVNHDYTR